MSLAVLTLSTTARASPAAARSPTEGSSTNTTSPSWSWANSVMPTVMTPSSGSDTHSWVRAYLRSSGMFMIPPRERRGRWVSRYPRVGAEEREVDDRRGHALATDLDADLAPALGEVGVHPGERDAVARQRGNRAACHLAGDVAPRPHDPVPLARHTATQEAKAYQP